MSDLLHLEFVAHRIFAAQDLFCVGFVDIIRIFVLFLD